MSADTYARSEVGTLADDPLLNEATVFSRCCSATRQGLAFFVSHVGLVSMVVGYCILGAITFEQLEQEHEKEVKRNMSKLRAEIGENIWRYTNSSQVLRQDFWESNVTNIMRDFEHRIIDAMKKNGWDGDESEERRKWTFAGSLFYSIVIVTTIGYGDQTPKTSWGKVATIIYAILGIPLFMLCLVNIGDTMARTFRFLYWRLCCVMCTARKKVRRRCRTSIRTPGNGRSQRHSLKFREKMSVGGISLAGASPRLPRRVTSMTPDDVISFTVSDYDTNLDDIDVRDLRKDKEDRTEADKEIEKEIDKDMEEEDEGIGELLTRESKTRESKKSAKSNKSLSLSLPLDHRRNEESSSSSCDVSKISTPTRGAENTNSRVTRLTGGEFFHEFEYEDWEEVDVSRPVPLWVCALLVGSYIFGGAFLFVGWEKWHFLDSAYFCFITLATIGFGDYVPKTKEKDAELNIVLCSVFLLFGMSLVVMTFHLVQEQIRTRVRNVAIKLGIIKCEEDEFMD